MKWSAVLAIALLGVLGSPTVAQQTGKTYRVGILRTGNNPAVLAAFRRTLSGLGYNEGKNLEIVDRSAGGYDKRLPELAAEIVRAKPDVIVTGGTTSTAAAQRATTSVPIVMATGTDPIRSGFIASLARPGGNITGVTNVDVELEGKRLELLKELVPHLQRVAVIGNSANLADAALWRETGRAGRTIGVAAVAVDIRTPDQIDAALKAIPLLHAGAILVVADPLLGSNAARIVRFAAAQRLPAIYAPDPFTEVGELMIYGPSITG